MKIPDLSKYPALDDFLNKTKDKFILDENNNVIPASLIKWAEFMETPQDRRRIDRTTIDEYLVSTVFIGLDHNFYGGLPHIFETMVFKGEKSYNHIYCDRCSTWKEAKECHKKAIKWVKDGCKEEDE